MKIINVVGVRPNFMKIAPLMTEYTKFANIDPVLVHTGQHYDEKMSDLFFRQLKIPEQDVNLGDRFRGSHTTKTVAIIITFKPIILYEKPYAVLVVGDVNLTIACELVVVKLVNWSMLRPTFGVLTGQCLRK